MHRFQVKLGENWKDFDSEVDEVLRYAVAAGQSSVAYDSRGQSYNCDLRAWEQWNLATGRKRKIRAPPDVASRLRSLDGACAPIPYSGVTRSQSAGAVRRIANSPGIHQQHRPLEHISASNFGSYQQHSPLGSNRVAHALGHVELDCVSDLSNDMGAPPRRRFWARTKKLAPGVCGVTTAALVGTALLHPEGPSAFVEDAGTWCEGAAFDTGAWAQATTVKAGDFIMDLF